MNANLGQLSGRVLQRIAATSLVFHFTRIPVYWGVLDRVRRALDLRAGESLLDVGCGTGLGAELTRGRYAGVDPERASLPLAKQLVARQPHLIAAMNASALGFRDAAFDKAILINMVHHLDDATADDLFGQLRRMVSGRVVVLDPAPDTANRISRFFLTYDRGRHVRPRGELRQLLERHYEVVAEEVFHNTLRIVSQVLFTLVPR